LVSTTIPLDGLLLQNTHHPNEIDGEINYIPTPTGRRQLVGGEDSIGTYKPYFVDTDKVR
jgi:hypothetical protein